MRARRVETRAMAKKSKTTKTTSKKKPDGNGAQQSGNGAQPPSGNGEQPDLTFYNAAVAEGKTLVAAIKSNTMQLGELADRVKAEYGEAKLAQYAKDIGVNVATLSRWRSVYRKWKRQKEAPGPVSASVLKALQGHPEADKVIEEHL